jgi:hypothetical protein
VLRLKDATMPGGHNPTEANMTEKPIVVTGTVKGAGAADARRLSVVALRGNTVLARTALRDNGSYRLTLPAHAARAAGPYALHVVVVPITAVDHVDRVPNTPRVPLARDALNESEITAPHLTVTEKLFVDWAIFWQEWCVSGTVVGPDGCPAPAAEVTVYTVSWTSQGYTKVPQATVTTAPDGSFTLCFLRWQLPFCWPCAPFWWLCWPWWWEEDILHVISGLEARVQRGSSAVALFQPEARSLIRGHGFSTARVGPASPDSARTALIARKLSNAALREIFPWHWWCCHGPNIVFSVSQAGTSILDEDPAVSTRWCMESGQTVTLTGNSATLTTCNQGTAPDSGVLWTSVGNITVGSIDAEGCAQLGGDASDVAFAGTLSLFAASALGAFDYYQVTGAVWNAPGFRGGTKPAAGSGAPIVASLWQAAWIYDPATHLATQHQVQMGPFTQSGIAGLYATPSARQNLAAPPGLAPFPAIPPGGQVFWQYEIPGLMLQCDATVLLGGALFGAVDLTIVGYKNLTHPPVTLVPDAPLTLMIDATPLTNVSVGSPSAWQSPGVPADNTGHGDCPAYDVGPSGFVTIPVTVQDNNGFLYGYYLEGDWGNSNSRTVSPPGQVGYATHANAQRNWTGGTDTYTFPGTTPMVPVPPADCCYEFRLWFGKRVTNGYGGPSLTDLPPTFQTINLKFSS